MASATSKRLGVLIRELEVERKVIDGRINNLEMAKEWEDSHARRAAVQTARPVRRNDRQWLQKTEQFILGRTRPVTVAAVSKQFGISRGAAQQRLKKLTEMGKAMKVKRGSYAAKKGKGK